MRKMFYVRKTVAILLLVVFSQYEKLGATIYYSINSGSWDEAINGNITVKSNPDKGTEFIVTIPNTSNIYY